MAARSRGANYLLGTGQAAEQILVGMIFEQGLDLLAIEVQLLVQKAQEFAQAQGKLAFGFGDRLGGFELVSPGKDGQADLGRFWSPKLVDMQEFLPTPLAGLDQYLRRRKLDEEVPRKGTGPIIEGLQRCRIILDQRLLKLVDQQGALLNQSHLILA